MYKRDAPPPPRARARTRVGRAGCALCVAVAREHLSPPSSPFIPTPLTASHYCSGRTTGTPAFPFNVLCLTSQLVRSRIVLFTYLQHSDPTIPYYRAVRSSPTPASSTLPSLLLRVASSPCLVPGVHTRLTTSLLPSFLPSKQLADRRMHRRARGPSLAARSRRSTGRCSGGRGVFSCIMCVILSSLFFLPYCPMFPPPQFPSTSTPHCPSCPPTGLPAPPRLRTIFVPLRNSSHLYLHQ